MTIQIIEIKNPKYANMDNSLIDLEIKFAHMPENFVWFTSSPTDTTSYGPEIYQQAVSGTFGTIESYGE